MITLNPVNALAGERWSQVERTIQAALEAVDPDKVVQKALGRQKHRLVVDGQAIDLDAFRRIRLVGLGKASPAMGRGVIQVLGDRILDGLLISKYPERANEGLPERVKVRQGNHPVPGEDSLTSGQSLAEFLAAGEEDDLVICLISGGGSSLVNLPREGVSLADLQELTRQLLASGAVIGEINCLRKHLDRIKGGGLAQMASPARLVTLILSDVIGSPLDVIASGPTVADPGTYAQALGILKKYNLDHSIPDGILSVLRAGEAGQLPETLKGGSPLLSRVQNCIVGSNLQAAEAALDQARREGFQALLLTTYLQGEASQAGLALASFLRQVDATGQPLSRPCCLAAGGETTVTLHGRGLGGRNQELALGACSWLEGISDVALISLGTDGEDGPTGAAGAVVTGDTMPRASQLGLDALNDLKNNDSNHFFQGLGDLVQTGPTGTNVNDLVLLFAF